MGSSSDTAPQISLLAFLSLVLGVGSFFLFIVTALPAIICGHIAWAKIRKSGGVIEGAGIALSGLVLGYVALGLSLLVIGDMATTVFAVSRARQEARQDALLARSEWNLRQVVRAQLIHAKYHDGRLPEHIEELREIFAPHFAAYMDLPHTEEVETYGYRIVPAMHLSMPNETIVAFEARPRDDGTIAVARLSGKIEIVPTAVLPENMR